MTIRQERDVLTVIQAYRGIAAIAVAAYHLSITCADNRYFGHGVFASITWRMDLGVDFFFVLSGFIIMFAHNVDFDRPNKIFTFFQKRFIRVYTPYWIYLLVFLFFAMLSHNTNVIVPNNLSQWITTITLVRFENFLLPISPAWTLVHEVAFYAMFAILILSSRIGIIVFILWQAACLWHFTFPYGDERTPANVYLSGYNLDFSFGILSYICLRYVKPRPPIIALGICVFDILFRYESPQYCKIEFILWNRFCYYYFLLWSSRATIFCEGSTFYDLFGISILYYISYTRSVNFRMV